MNSSSFNDAYFLPYQLRWLQDESRLRICEKSRQVGLSYADSYDSVRKAAVRGGRDVWVMSRDETQAKQYIRYCKRWANVLQLAGADYGEHVLSIQGKAVSVQVLSFASRASIYALSSNPDAIVGKTGHVKLDEFALHKDQRTLYAVAKPVIQWGGTLSVISTHRGAATVFNELLTEIREHGNPMGWALHSIPIQVAVQAGLVEKIDAASGGQLTAASRTGVSPVSLFVVPPSGGSPFVVQPLGCQDSGLPTLASQPSESGAATMDSAGQPPTFTLQPPVRLSLGDGGSTLNLRHWWLAQQRAECIDQEQWLQEYCCVPADETSAFISYELLTACTEPDLRLLSLEQLRAYLDDHPPATIHHPLFLGMDVARKKDLTVLDVGEKMGDVVWDRLRLELAGRPFGEIEEALYRLLGLPQLQRACLDATGMGLQLAERARERFEWKIEPITFTAPVKEALATGLRMDLEKRQLRLVDDAQLRADLRGIRKQISLSGNSRYAGEIEGSHCDRFWAKALRQHAARQRQFGGALVG